MTNHHFKLVALLYLCAAFYSCAAEIYIKNIGRVEVVIHFNECSAGGMDPVHKQEILKPGQLVNFNWWRASAGFLGSVHCWIYVLSLSRHPTRWNNLITTIKITQGALGSQYIPIYLDYCQQPCRIKPVSDYSFLIV